MTKDKKTNVGRIIAGQLAVASHIDHRTDQWYTWKEEFAEFTSNLPESRINELEALFIRFWDMVP
jgi:hypothetical protein